MELSNAVLAAALGAALMNAGWNSAIKLGGDKMVAMALTTGLASLWSLLVLPWLDWRAAALWDASVWWWLAASVAVHTVYHFVLPRAYQHGEFGVVYPVARGSAPLFVTLGAALLAGEWPGATGLAGVLCLSLGVLALSLRSGAASGYGGSGYALATGAMIACYTVIDGLGARASGSALLYAALLTLGDGLATVLIVAWLMRERLGRVRMLASALVFGGIVLGRWGGGAARRQRRLRAQPWLMRVPSRDRNCAIQAGWAGQAGALTRLPSVCAWSTPMSA